MLLAALSGGKEISGSADGDSTQSRPLRVLRLGLPRLEAARPKTAVLVASASLPAAKLGSIVAADYQPASSRLIQKQRPCQTQTHR